MPSARGLPRRGAAGRVLARYPDVLLKHQALRGSTRLHQLSKRWADSREFWGLAGVQALGEFMNYDADLWRKASAYKGLEKSASYCFEN